MAEDLKKTYSELTNAGNLERKLSQGARRLMQKSQGLVSKTTDLLKPYRIATKNSGSTSNASYNNMVNSASTVSSYTPGSRVANTASYNNNAAKGQCVWYVRGRATEKLGVDPGAIGNANEMWYNAKSDAKVQATADNIRPNMLVSYGSGTGSGGQKYGHVIFVEDVVGDTVYYTEGGSGYYKNGTDGVVKTATRQGILNGINSSGAKMGNNVIGFIDLTKY